tara:strand:- start:38 stop:715 length:678 start_codon:yes stop_codon:yes gene_type:complete
VIHYHGTPLSPQSALYAMAGKNFCVSFHRPDDVKICKQIGQSLMLDNGAFSFYTKGAKPCWGKYYKWLEAYLGHPHWAVVPDVIDGRVEDNLALAKQWPHDKAVSCAVWHMAEPISQLFKLLDMGFAKIAFGSSGAYWQVGSVAWSRRCDEAWNALAKNGKLPWIHMMRGLSLGGKHWPFASADSTNVALHHKECGSAEFMARQIDSAQTPIVWELQMEQMDLIK